MNVVDFAQCPHQNANVSGNTSKHTQKQSFGSHLHMSQSSLVGVCNELSPYVKVEMLCQLLAVSPPSRLTYCMRWLYMLPCVPLRGSWSMRASITMTLPCNIFDLPTKIFFVTSSTVSPLSSFFVLSL